MATMLDPGQDERGKEIVENIGQDDIDKGIDELEKYANNPDGDSKTDLAQDENSGQSRFHNAAKDQAHDPEGFGGTPFGKHAGKGGLGGMLAGGGSKFANFMKKPRVAITAAVSVITAIIGIITFVLSIPFQLIHMIQNLLHFNFDVGDYVEEKASRQVIARLLQKQKLGNGGRASSTGRPIHDKLTNMKINRFNANLAKDGIALKFADDGRLLGVEQHGRLVTDLSDKSIMDRRGGIADLVKDRIAPWRVLKRIKYTRIMRFHANVSWKFWLKEKIPDMRSHMNERIRRGASPTEVRENGGNGNQEEERARASAEGRSDAADSVRRVGDEFDRSGNKRLAIRAGIAQMKLKPLFGITGITALVCTIKAMVDDNAYTGYIERVEMLMRVGNMLLTMESQMREGTLNLEDFGKVMTSFNGDPTTPADSSDRKGFDQSAAWKRINGESVNGDPSSPNYNPDLNPSANPDGFALYDLTHRMEQVIGGAGGKLVCSLATGVFGFILQIGEVGIGVASGGAAAAVSIGVQAAASYVIFHQVLPSILESAASLAITGSDNAVDMLNHADAGLALSASNYLRAMGGRTLTNAEQRQLALEVQDHNIQIAREKGWFWRTLDVANYQSSASRLIASIPTSGPRAYTAITSMPKTFASAFTTAFLGLKPASAVPLSLNGYKFQYNGFTSAELEKYDFDENEKFLTEKLPNTGLTRLAMLGDPTEYSEEANPNDLLHCFIVKFRPPDELKATDPICHSIGSLTNRTGQADNPTDQEIANVIYCEKNKVCNLKPNDDFLRFRLQMLYSHITQGLACAASDEDCQPQGSGSAPPPTNPTGSERELAAQILGNSKINIRTAEARLDLQYTAEGKAIAECGLGRGLNATLLQVILKIAEKYPIAINYFDTGHGCDSGFHPKGRAVDLDEVGILNNKPAQEHIVSVLPDGGGLGQKQCMGAINGTSRIRYFNDVCNHIHVDVGAGAP
jgi:hypothetical protein